MASTMLLSECVTISDQGYSLRVIHVLVEGIAHVQALGDGSGSGPRVSSEISVSRELLGSSRRVRLSWNDKRVSYGPIAVELTLPILAHKPDAVLYLHRCSLASAVARAV